VLEIEAVDGRNRSHASSVWSAQPSQDDACNLQASLRPSEENRADAARGKSEVNGVRNVDVFNYEFTTFRECGASRIQVDTVEGVSSRGYAIPLRGWRK